MLRKILFISLLGIIGSALLFGFTELTTTTHAQANPLAVETEQRILKATVQMVMVREEINGTKAVYEIDEGIGTLLNYGGEFLIVTHNHWPQVVDSSKPDFVRFHDAQGERLLKIDGVAFQRAILYRDGGTLVMRAPLALVNKLAAVEAVSAGQDVNLGDSLYVVRHRPGVDMEVEILETQVTAVEDDGQYVVMTLLSLNGQSIEPGDSGGGIWSEDALVGNMWMTVREEWTYPENPQEVQMVVTDRSRAAGLTVSIMDLVWQSLVNAKEMPRVSDALVME
jgi:hypothetical protein